MDDNLYENLQGWVPNPAAVERAAAIEGELETYASHLFGSERKNTYLWEPLLKVKPDWRRGAQGIGDCVSWGTELAATCLMAIQHVQGNEKFEAEAATESIYGGCRVEVLNKRSGGWSDGAFGYAAAKWLNEYGVLLRRDYSQETGNDEHNLLKYSKTKAKNWGNYGCGGRFDKGELDKLAKRMPVKKIVRVKTLDGCESAILNWYPVTIASMAGFGRRKDSNGVIRRSGRWAHLMVILGVCWINGKRYWRIFNSWGTSVSGPDPLVESKAVQDCSWWATDSDVAWILRSGDCWALADVEGMPKRELDFDSIAGAWS